MPPTSRRRLAAVGRCILLGVALVTFVAPLPGAGRPGAADRRPQRHAASRSRSCATSSASTGRSTRSICTLSRPPRAGRSRPLLHAADRGGDADRWPPAGHAAAACSAAIVVELAIGLPVGHHRRRPARQRRRPRGDGAVLRRRLDRRSSSSAILLLYVFAVRLGWFPIGGYGGLAAPRPAGADAGHPRRRLVCADDALEHDRRAAPGLHPHGPRQGAGERRVVLRPRAAQRASCRSSP